VTASGSSGRERWPAVTDLFARALERPVDERETFVRRAAGGDATMAEEVLSLLDAHQRAGDFMARPPVAAAPGDGDHERPSAGQHVGHYRILGVLGEGGMGVVYLAEDTRLRRTVALKAVAPALAGDATRTERLRREARAAAGLTHPNIATIYALEEIDGRLYIGSEYVPGTTLRDELARGPLPVARVLDTALALASALVAAHGRGVVHRDLKPENVIRTPDGVVKVLDFGLAQVTDAGADAADLTADGGVFGTPAYMSPEQIRGGAVDGRSDIFSLGVLLFELATGATPFAGPTPAATLARILQDDPSPAALDSAADPVALDRLRAIVLRCLRKAPEDRFQTAGEIVAALDPRHAAVRTLPSAGRPPARGSLWWWQFHQTATILAYALLMVPAWVVRHEAPGPLGMGLFLGGLASAIVSASLRLHVWFAVRQLPQAWRVQIVRTRSARAIADGLFAGVLLLEGLRSTGVDDRAAGLFVAAAAAVAVSFVVVEPATTRTAFGPQSS
jgi:Protein kinase domain